MVRKLSQKTLFIILIISVILFQNDSFASYPDTNTRTIGVGSAPTSLAVASGQLFVANSFDDTVSVIDLTTYSVTDTISVGGSPEHIIAGSGGAKVYVSNYNDDSISVISASTLNVTKTISNVGDGPGAMCLSKSGNKLYVACKLGSSISIISTIDNSKTGKSINTGGTPSYIARSETGKYLYVTLESDSSVVLVNLNTEKLTSTKTAVGSTPNGIAVTPNGNYIYTANNIGNSITNISTSSNSMVETIVSAGDGLKEITILDNGEYAFLTRNNESAVTVLDIFENSVVTTLTVGTGPYGILSSTDNQYLYVTNRTDNTVTIFEDQSKIVIDSVVTNYLNDSGTVAITWHTETDGAYQVEAGGTGTKGTGTVIATGSAVTSTPIQTDVAAATYLTGVDTNYKIYFYLTDALSAEFSNDTTLVLDNTAPATPTGIKTYFDDENIVLSWNDTTDTDLEGYKIYYGTVTGVYTYTVNINVKSSSTLKGLENGTKYYIKISAIDMAGNESARSIEVTETPDEIVGLAGINDESSCFIATASYKKAATSAISRLISRVCDYLSDLKDNK